MLGGDPRFPRSIVLRKRAVDKLQDAHPRAQSCVAELRHRGARVRIVGSMARVSVRETSDVDIYIEDPGPLKETEIEQIARRTMRDFPFDLIYAHKLAPGKRKHFGE